MTRIHPIRLWVCLWLAVASAGACNSGRDADDADDYLAFWDEMNTIFEAHPTDCDALGRALGELFDENQAYMAEVDGSRDEQRAEFAEIVDEFARERARFEAAAFPAFERCVINEPFNAAIRRFTWLHEREPGATQGTGG